MDEPTKMEAFAEDYWLQLKANDNSLDIVVICYQDHHTRKFNHKLYVNDKIPQIAPFKTPLQILKLIRLSQNYQFDIPNAVFSIKWKIVAGEYSKDIVYDLYLNPGQLTELDQLKFQNMMLKKKIQVYQSKSPKEKHQSIQSSDDNVDAKNSKQTVHKIQQPRVQDYVVQIQEDFDQTSKKKESISSSNIDVDQELFINKEEVPRRTKRKPIRKQKDLIVKISQIDAGQKQKEKRRRGRKKKSESYPQPELKQKKQSTVQASKIKISFANGDYYFGEIKNNLYHGHGLYFSLANGTFQGQWQNGKANGYGMSQDPVGNKHSGFYINDKRNGKGVDDYVNGQRYEGNFVMDCKQGYGKYTYKNGDYYEGYWKQDLYNGKGVEYYGDGTHYQGNWLKDEKDGEGTFYQKDGTKWKQVWLRGSKIKQSEID